jgi:hypothetical protein
MPHQSLGLMAAPESRTTISAFDSFCFQLRLKHIIGGVGLGPKGRILHSPLNMGGNEESQCA